MHGNGPKLPEPEPVAVTEPVGVLVAVPELGGVVVELLVGVVAVEVPVWVGLAVSATPESVAPEST